MGKKKLIISLSVVLSIVIALTVVLCVLFVPRNKSNMIASAETDPKVFEEFLSRTKKSKNWTTEYYNDGSYAVCRTINGCLTNDFYDVSIEDDGTYWVTHSGVKFDKQKVLPAYSFTYEPEQTVEEDGVVVKTLIETKKQTIYYISGDVATPIDIYNSTYQYAAGYAYPDIVCINLNDGSFVDYKTICTVGGE